MNDFLNLRAAITSGSVPDYEEPSHAEKVSFWTEKGKAARTAEDRAYARDELHRLMEMSDPNRKIH